jgi:hypothetical protein
MHLVVIRSQIEKHKEFAFGKTRWTAEDRECVNPVITTTPVAFSLNLFVCSHMQQRI